MDKAGIKHDPRNARRHTPRNVGMIENSIQRDGFGRSILLANDGTVIAGNATMDAAASAGLDDVIVVETDGTKVVAVKRTDVAPGSKEFHNLALADNRAAELAEWDEMVIAELNEELDLSAFFGDDELGRILGKLTTEGKTDPDAVPEVKESTTKPGDLWLLGRHRLLCGDSTVATDVERLMGGERADMVFADPPYGMDLDTDFSSMAGPTSLSSKRVKAGGKYEAVIGDGEPFDPAPIMALFPDDVEQFWWGADYYAERIPARAGGAFLVWDKRVDESLDKRFGSSFELVWSRQRHKREIVRVQWAGFFGMQNEDTVSRIHPTQKPTELAAWFMGKYSKPDALILDPFLGSGTTLIAAEQLNRTCYGMEIDPHYCDVIVKRWEQFTGQTAILEHHAMAAD